jgi:hypothetical protein
MEDQTEQALPKQSFIERQLSEAITPASERAKLAKSFGDFCEEIDAQGEASPEPAKAPAEPVVAKAASVEQPATQITLQPTPPPPLDPLDQQARQMEVGAYITRHPSYKQERIATQRAYEDVVREMSRHFDADPERVKADFTDPLLTSFSPDQLTDEWFQQQVDLMRNASPIIKRKIEAKWLQVQELQARHGRRPQRKTRTGIRLRAATSAGRVSDPKRQKRLVRISSPSGSGCWGPISSKPWVWVSGARALHRSPFR